MDHLGLFHRKLRFIWWSYYTGAAPFKEIMRKIEAYEQPYVWHGDPDDFSGEPPFLEEWQDASMAVNILGQSCLGLVLQSLKEYIYGHTEVLISHNNGTNRRLPPKHSKKGWFQWYKKCYEEEHHLNWDGAPVNLEFIEHMILTRNDTQHYLNDFDLHRRQDQKHFQRHPDGVFVDEAFRSSEYFAAQPGYITVTAEGLRKAMDEVERFARFIEGDCKPGVVQRRERAWPPEEPGTHSD